MWSQLTSCAGYGSRVLFSGSYWSMGQWKDAEDLLFLMRPRLSPGSLILRFSWPHPNPCSSSVKEGLLVALGQVCHPWGQCPRS